MSAMVIPTARVSGARSGSAAERARQAWFAGASGARSTTVPTPRRSRPAAPAEATSRPHGSVVAASRAHGAETVASRAHSAATAAPRPQAPEAPAHSSAGPVPGAQRPAATASRPQRHAATRVQDAGALRRPVPAARQATVRAEDRPLRLTRRGRLVVLLLAGLVLAGGIQGGQALADGPSRALEVTTYTVAAGETLWDIAAAQARPGEDVRDVVLELKSLNELRTAGLAAGQEIILPAQR